MVIEKFLDTTDVLIDKKQTAQQLSPQLSEKSQIWLFTEAYYMLSQTKELQA